MKTKECSKCRQIKSTTEFYKNKLHSDGLRSECKECQRQYYKEHTKEKKQYWKEHREEKKQYRKEHRVHRAFRNAKWCSKKKGREFTITEQEYTMLTSMPCYYCGRTDIDRGVDRIINTVGYTMDNCISCCKHCNIMKSSLRPFDFIHQIDLIYQKHVAFMVKKEV